jgi:hypothetical protein
MDKQYPPVDDIQIVQREQTTHPDGDTTMEEQYSLEEWLGMLEEAGYSLEEGSVEDETSALKAALSARGSEKTLGKGMADIKTALQRLQAARKAAKTNESYTLEEWMGMLEEVGYDISEYSLWRPKESGAKSTGVMKDPKKPKTPPAEPTKPKKKLDELSPELKARYAAAAHTQVDKEVNRNWNRPNQEKIAKRLKGMSTAYQTMPGTEKTSQAVADVGHRIDQTYALQQKAANSAPRPQPTNPTTNRPPLPPQTSVGTARPPLPGSKPPVPPATRSGPPPVPPLPSKKPKLPPLPGRAVAEAINENTVSRLQSLAGIKPTE